MNKSKPTPPPLTLKQAAAMSGLSISAIRMRGLRGIEPIFRIGNGRDWYLPHDWQPKRLKYTRKTSEVSE